MVNLNGDLDSILDLLGRDIEMLAGKRIFITGGTGFFGRWLLETLVHANRMPGFDLFMTVLTRNPDKFLRSAPHLANSSHLEFLCGDVRDFVFPQRSYDFIIHAAADADDCAGGNALRALDTIVSGTRRILDFAVKCRVEGLLLVSSGAVYGRQPPAMARVSEDFTGAPEVGNPRNVYGESKRLAEMLGAIYAAESGLRVTMARCFAFIGPFMPLNGHFAAGNFVRDALRGGPVNISGDGTPLRSYMYPVDLVVWLLSILLRGRPGVSYNVGSDVAVSLRELAESIAAETSPAVPVVLGRTPESGTLPQRYVPDISRAASELGLKQTVSLPEAVRRTMNWYRRK